MWTTCVDQSQGPESWLVPFSLNVRGEAVALAPLRDRQAARLSASRASWLGEGPACWALLAKGGTFVRHNSVAAHAVA